jgi:hypothetical protein
MDITFRRCAQDCSSEHSSIHRVSGTNLISPDTSRYFDGMLAGQPRALIWALHNLISFRIELTRNYFQWFYIYSPCDWLIEDRPGAGPEVARPAVHPSLVSIGIKLVFNAYISKYLGTW